MITLRDLFAGAAPERLAAIEAALAVDEKTHTPWYIQALIVVGAWLASIFLLVFVLMVVDWSLFNDQHRTPIGVIGVVLLIATLAVRRVVSGLFFAQCCLAFSLAGQGMILFGFVPDGENGFGTAVLMVCSLALVLYFLYPDFLHRTVTTLAAVQVTYWWIVTSDYFKDAGKVSLLVPGPRIAILDLYFLAQLAGMLWCLLPLGRHEARRPIGYALVASLAAVAAKSLLFGWFMEDFRHAVVRTSAVQPWYSYIDPICTAGAFFFVAVWAAGGGRLTLARYGQKWIPFGALLGLFLFLNLGPVLLALLIMLLGFSLQNRPVLGSGVLLFAVFLSHYYYNLQLDLMEKAGVLVLSGGLLLLLRGSLSRLISKEAA